MTGLIALSADLRGQKYSFIQYNTNDGLAQSQVKHLFQDSKGYIWCGTITGASRFDGRSFRNYSIQHGLIGSQVSCITELRSGIIVLGTPGGISLVDNEEVKSIPFPTEFKDATVNDLVEDQEGKLWIGTNFGMLESDLEICDEVDSKHPAFGHNVKRILFEDANNWTLVTRDGVVRLEGAVTTEVYNSGGEVALFDAEYDSLGTLWVACNNPGLMGFRDDGFVEYGTNNNLISSSVSEVMVDRYGGLWLSTLHGISRINDGIVRSYGLSSGLPAEKVNMTLEDSEGNIWIATDGKGLVKFTGENFEIFTTNDGLCSNGIMSITEDTLGSLWFASHDNGVCQGLNDENVSYNLDKFTENNRRFWTSLTDSRGQVWLGSSNGLVLYSDGEFHDFAQASLHSRKVLSLFEDRSNQLWIGTASGINVIRDLSNPIIETVDGAPKVRVRCVKQDQDGTLWMATRSGVWNFDGQEFNHFSEAEGLSENKTYCLDLDDHGRLWVGTGYGVSIYDGNEWKEFLIPGTSDANHINFLKCIDSFMWVGTNGGLYRFESREDLWSEEPGYDHFSLQDGLANLETNLNSVFQDSKNNLWFGTADGLVRIDLKKGVKSPSNYQPRIHFTGVDVNLERAQWSDYGLEAANSSSVPANLELPYKDNSMTFHFNGISMSYPNDVRYQFMLEGLDTEWQPVTKAELAHYSNLPFNEYRFRVRAIGKAGTLGDMMTFSFIVLPPFWMTWWFISLCIVLFSSATWLVFRRRKQALLVEMAKEKFENRSKMLALEQQTLNSSLNRHFIFNALNSIQYYINRKDRLSANKYLSAFARLIRMNLDSSQTNLTTLREEIERLELYLGLEHMRFRDKFEYSINVEDDVDLDSVKVPSMLLQPFLENSIWHGILPMDKSGTILVNIARSNGSIELTIKDNGIGIETSLRKKQEAGNHISKGMQITSGRIELIKKITSENVELRGPYEIRDEKNLVSGTEVMIILPETFHEIYPN
jgi:ligand-binding sensor domain-containing protein